jgi:hypothetical protein
MLIAPLSIPNSSRRCPEKIHFRQRVRSAIAIQLHRRIRMNAVIEYFARQGQHGLLGRNREAGTAAMYAPISSTWIG